MISISVLLYVCISIVIRIDIKCNSRANKIAKTQLELMLPLGFRTDILSLSPRHIPSANANLQANLLVLQLFASESMPSECAANRNSEPIN